MDKQYLWDQLKEQLATWNAGNGSERPEDEALVGIAFVLELMLRAEERS